MYSRCFTLFLLCLVAALYVRAQDSSWYYRNNVIDFATADIVCLVNVGETRILDTIGGYTVQEVAFEPVKFYKGKTQQRTFRAWLENHEVVWKPGTTRGFYFLNGENDSSYKADPGIVHHYWLENAGFTLNDTSFIASLTDTGRFKQLALAAYNPDVLAAWAKVNFLELLPSGDVEYSDREALIQLKEAVPVLKLEKGQTIKVLVHRSAYKSAAKFLEQVNKTRNWDLLLFWENGRLELKTEFMLEQ